MTVVLYLIGNPGAGKYTIAKELAMHGYIICDNQLINNPIFSLINCNGLSAIPLSAWDAIGQIRNIIFDFLSHENQHNYVLTNVLYENNQDHEIYNQVEQMALNRQSIFIPVKLMISQEENIKRIQIPDRRQRNKTINTDNIYSAPPLIQITHPNLIELDVTFLTAKAAAEEILSRIKTIH